MLKIGDFSKISRASIKTLRYYDEIALLKPHHVDQFTGYRYYSFDQLPRINRILAMRDLGLSLEQIMELISDDLPVEQLRGMLKLKQAEIKEKMREELDRLSRVEARLNQIEQENTMSNFDVIVKNVETIHVASIRGTIPSYPEQGSLWHELENFLSEHTITPTGPCFTIYHSDEPEIIAEVCEPVDTKVPSHPKVITRELPSIEIVASIVHHGPFVTLGDAYESILKWIEMNNYKIIGPPREIYLSPPADNSQTDPNTVTEVQFPIAKGE